MRLDHGFMIAIAICIGSLIALQGQQIPPVDKLLLAIVAAVFLEASTFALNDYYDFDIDTKNKRRDRPLVRGDLLPRTALYLFIILFPLGILCAVFVNLVCFIIAVVTGLFAIMYDVKLKKIKLLGNFYIAYTMAIPFIFGGAAVLRPLFSFAIHPATYTLALIAFFAGAGREIMKDVMDYEGDKKHGVISFPSVIGIRASNILTSCFYILASACSFLPFFMPLFDLYYQNLYYLTLVLLTDTMLLSTSLQLLVKKHPDVKTLRKFTLFALFIGLLAFLIGAFIH